MCFAALCSPGAWCTGAGAGCTYTGAGSGWCFLWAKSPPTSPSNPPACVSATAETYEINKRHQNRIIMHIIELENF